MVFRDYNVNLDLHDLSTHADVSIDEHNSALLLSVSHDERPTVLTEVDAIVDLGWHGIPHLHKKQQQAIWYSEYYEHLKNTLEVQRLLVNNYCYFTQYIYRN